MRALRLAVLGFLLCLAKEGRAQAPADATFDVEYRAPAACPDEAAFVAAILARVPSARRVDTASAAVRFDAEVSAEGPGSLLVGLAEGVSRREIASASCDEAVASMALIAAMVLEAPADTRAAVIGVPVVSAEPEPAPQFAPEPEPAPVAPPPLPQPPELDTGVGAKPPRTAASRPPRWGVNAAVGLETAVAPSPPPLVALGVELRWDRSAFWSPSVGVQAVATAEAVETTPDGDATFRLLTGRVNACPVRFGSTALVRLAPCATFDIGGLRGAGGRSVKNARSAWAPWLALGLGLRGELELGSGLRLDAALAGRVLARHDRFVFEHEDLIYDIPALSLGFELGFAFWP